jgi:hypothetical protein
MQRRSFLTALGTAPVMTGLQRPSSSSQPPRKVIAGTVMQPYWEQHPGLKNRLTQLTGNVDRMQEESQHRFGPRAGPRYSSRSRGDGGDRPRCRGYGRSAGGRSQRGVCGRCPQASLLSCSADLSEGERAGKRVTPMQLSYSVGAVR